MMQRQMRSGWNRENLNGLGMDVLSPALYVEERGARMEAIVKAVVIGVLTVVIAALNQGDGDE